MTNRSWLVTIAVLLALTAILAYGITQTDAPEPDVSPRATVTPVQWITVSPRELSDSPEQYTDQFVTVSGIVEVVAEGNEMGDTGIVLGAAVQLTHNVGCFVREKWESVRDVQVGQSITVRGQMRGFWEFQNEVTNILEIFPCEITVK